MTDSTALPDLRIGDLRFNPPIIQGGMGVRISGVRLASAVSNEGALGVVASVGTGEDWPDRSLTYAARSYVSLRDMLQHTKALTPNPIAVNIMCALTNYDDLVRAADEEAVAAIISGAGLPLHLPALVTHRRIKLIPIVSSGRAADLLCRSWWKRHHRLPDALIVEGPLAGGHLGFSMDDVATAHIPLEALVRDVLSVAAGYTQVHGLAIPVIAAGGVFTGRDMARLLQLGASGVQLGTRFVCTDECDASVQYKEAYLRCRPEDILVMQSPLKLPLRVIRNRFVERLLRGERMPFRCPYRCLATCEPATSPYCIAQALVNAYRGDMDAGFATCGATAYRIDRIVSVRDLIQELVADCRAHLGEHKNPGETTQVEGCDEKNMEGNKCGKLCPSPPIDEQLTARNQRAYVT
jgi:NAD(P)H-dependent flavin oxidoreductase YrpB (nitropropane dioxygenase family)